MSKMRVLVLTSVKQRHLYLVNRLCEQGYTVLAWAEKKGQHLNQQSFNAHSKQLLDIHAQALSNALDELIPEVAMDDVPLEVFERGVFRNDELTGRARQFAPDIVVVYGCGIVGQPMFSLFEGRLLGSHQGLPQYYRGSGSNFFAFLNGQSSLMGISVHLVDAGIDTGPVIAQRSPKPRITDTYYSYSASLVVETIDLYVKAVEHLEGQSLDNLSMPLPTEGQLYQRKDFTPDVLRRMILMQLGKSFYAWYQESLEQVGPPELIGLI